jgi:hypothetical protein
VPIREDNDGSIVTVTLEGAIEATELEAHFERMRALLGRIEGPVATIVDASTLDYRSLGRAHLGVMRRLVKGLRPLLKGRYAAEAFVSPDEGVRRAVSVARFVARPAKAHRIFASVDEARSWVEEALGR